MKNKEQKELKAAMNIIAKEELTTEEIQTRKKSKINILICLIQALLFIIYFGITNLVRTSIPINNFDIYIKISYIVFIIIAILMLEIAYKKEKKSFAIYGIEFILLAVHVLLIGHNITTINNTEKLNILKTSFIWIIYYCFKALFIYTIENRRRLKQISDISEIVKEEKPTKKVAKKRKT